MHSRRKLIDGTHRAVRRLAGLGPCERGAVAPLIGFAMIVLVGAVGVAIDIGRGQVAQSKLQSSLDSAGLAAGAMVGQTLDSDDLKPEAEKYLRSNFAGETIDATITDFDLQLADDQSVVTLEAKATLPTTFMRVFGQQKIDVAARSEITRETKGLEVAVVLDVTGSMDDPVGGTGPGSTDKKITVLRIAAKDLINILFGSNDTVDDLWVGVVPFSQSVNVGTEHADWMADLDSYLEQDNCIGPNSHSNWTHTHVVGETAPDYCPTNGPNVSTRTKPHTLVDAYMFADDPTSPKVNGPGITPAAPALTTPWYFAPHTWGGCVLERWTNNRDVTDDPPATQKWDTYFVPDTSGSGNNNWRSNTGNYNVDIDNDISANKGCPQQPITTLTNVKASLITAVDDLVNPRGNTHINLGAVWGWRLLSPEWRNLWGGDMDAHGLPLDYHEQLSQKAMILMTDGENTMTSGTYTAYSWIEDGHLGTTSSSTTARTTLNTKTTAVCNAMKAEGILIYTIVFGNGSSTSAKNLMKACASEEDFYFFSPSQDALKGAFRAIGDSLSKLRVSK
jgi:Flp pilus assembly protein TadG